MPKWEPDRVQAALIADLQGARHRYRARRASHQVLRRDDIDGIALWSDDEEVGWIPLRIEGDRAVSEMLARSFSQLQGDAMDHETEPWPLCPEHYHELRPEPQADWVVWVCPTTGDRIGAFGALLRGAAG
jgi:hypothetical protein